jgi:hypothetical protein
LAIIVSLYFRFRYLGEYNRQEIALFLQESKKEENSFLVYLPLFFVILYMIAEIRFHEFLPHLGVPLIFIIGAAMGLVTKKGIKLITVSREALRSAMPVMAILVGVGMFLQIMALTGVRGYLAVVALDLPEGLRYFAATIMPFMGSAYGSASVIGVPLVYVFIGKSALVVTAALVLMAALGDLMPPPALLCAYSSQIVEEKNHFKILKVCLIPIVISMAFGVLMLVFAQEISNFIN